MEGEIEECLDVEAGSFHTAAKIVITQILTQIKMNEQKINEMKQEGEKKRRLICVHARVCMCLSFSFVVLSSFFLFKCWVPSFGPAILLDCCVCVHSPFRSFFCYYFIFSLCLSLSLSFISALLLLLLLRLLVLVGGVAILFHPVFFFFSSLTLPSVGGSLLFSYCGGVWVCVALSLKHHRHFNFFLLSSPLLLLPTYTRVSHVLFLLLTDSREPPPSVPSSLPLWMER